MVGCCLCVSSLSVPTGTEGASGVVGTVMFLLAKQERLEHVGFVVEGLGDLEHGPLESAQWSDCTRERGKGR